MNKIIMHTSNQKFVQEYIIKILNLSLILINDIVLPIYFYRDEFS